MRAAVGRRATRRRSQHRARYWLEAPRTQPSS